MERWANCPGSVRLCAPLTSKSGFAAAEGTVAHSMAERALKGEKWVDAFLGTTVEQDGHKIPITQEMVNNVLMYKAAVKTLCNENTVRHVEHKFHLAKLHEALFGTSDVVLWDPIRKHLDVIDFKYGAGMAVEVTDNRQCRYYGVGALIDLGYPAKTIDVHIVQPRCPHADGPHRTAHYDVLDLLDFAADMVDAVKATEAPNAPLKPGAWCRKSFCPAQAICPAQQQLAQEQSRYVFAKDLAYDPDQLAATLDWLPVLEGWIKSVREFAYAEAEDGRVPPGHKLVEKQAREKWAPLATPLLIANKFGLDVKELTEEPELKSPAQVRKLVPGKNDKERASKLAEFTVKESSEHTLVPADDKRQSVKESAKTAFSCPVD